MKKAGLGVALCAAVLGAPPARAHELWLERSGGGFALRAGHLGGETEAVDPATVRAVRCVRAGAPVRELAPRAAEGGTVRVEGRCDAASAFVDHGFFVVTPDGEKHLRKREAPDAVRSWRSRQFAKWVDARAPAAPPPLGDALEILPVTELARARVGDKVTLRVLLEGRPAPGAIVSVGHERLAETSSAGEARIRVRHAGLESVSATLRRPLGTPDADTEVLEASLSFEVPR
jgi:nickel transport protein